MKQPVSSLDHSNGFCAPGRIQHYIKSGTCLLPEEIKEIVGGGKEKFDSLLNKLRAKLPNSCKNDYCLLQNRNIAQKVSHAFRPKKPKEWQQDERYWLSTEDIIGVMKQYEDAHPDFEFIGVFPRDFQGQHIHHGSCVVNRLCDTNAFLDDFFKSGKTTFGMVFNLDLHYQSGSHWVAILANFDVKDKMYGIYYYDAVAIQPWEEFKKFMTEVQAYMYSKVRPEKERKFPKQINKHRRQFSNTECGVFSMLYIILCLERKKDTHFRKVCIEMGTDDAVASYRNILYTPSK